MVGWHTHYPTHNHGKWHARGTATPYNPPPPTLHPHHIQQRAGKEQENGTVELCLEGITHMYLFNKGWSPADLVDLFTKMNACVTLVVSELGASC